MHHYLYVALTKENHVLTWRIRPDKLEDPKTVFAYFGFNTEGDHFRIIPIGDWLMGDFESLQEFCYTCERGNILSNALNNIALNLLSAGMLLNVTEKIPANIQEQ